MELRTVYGCYTPSCQAEGTVEITDKHDPEYSRRFCPDCFAIIESVLAETSRMVKLGTPGEVAADWAGAAVMKKIEKGEL